MSSEASVFQTSGGGYDYEHYVQCSFLTLMILQGSIPIFPNGKINEICFQCKNKGYTTDDLFLEVNDVMGKHRIITQIKYNIALTDKNQTFIEVINAFWQDFNKTDIFDKTKDKLFLIKSGLTNDDKNHISVLLDWASTHKNEEDFYSEVERIDIKRQKLLIFTTLLKSANGNTDVAKKDVWQFLNCFKLLSYDFASENSTDQTNLLNLIKLSKSKESTATPLEIYNSILAKSTEYNRTGGSIDLESIITLDIYKYFDLSLIQDAYVSLNKLVDEGKFIIKPIINSIKGFHIDRSSIRLDILNSINQNQITFVTGTPGVGKSAIIKELLEIELSDSLPFIFKADQFNKLTLAQVFTEIGISHNLSNLLSTISLLQNKIIIIDSGEKLLEGDSDNAFKQLLEIVKENNDLKIIVTSRSYAVNIIAQKYNIANLTLIEIPSLSDSELESATIAFPQIDSLLKNKEIKEILRSPKYLEFSLNAIGKEAFQSQNISLKDFKDKLWFQIIENGNVIKNGIARKREKTFNHIAVGRAISMQLFFQPEDTIAEYDAIDALLNDDIISKNGLKYEFTPSHDILEDWALIRHIALIQKELKEDETIFEKLGNQPALRRAFRLWIEELLLTNNEIVFDLVKHTLSNDKIQRYWVDEILTAIFRSKNCKPFFDTFEKLLIENNAFFLNRCILICRTTCKEYSYKDHSSKDILLPVGSAWEEILDFVAVHYEKIIIIRSSILNFLLDWEYKYMFNIESCTDREIEAANFITITFIKEIEKQEEYWFSSELENRFNEIIYLLFSFSPYDIENEIKTFLERIINQKKDESTWQLNDFYKKVIEIALGGIRNQKVIKQYPDIIIKLANKSWRQSAKKTERNEDVLGYSFSNRKERDESWGVKKYRFNFFPAGLYKTFVYNLMKSNPIKGVEFVVDFTNYMTKSYAESEHGIKDCVTKIEIVLNDGGINQQYANYFLWLAYRGTVVTDDLLESILVGFEKYLLQMADSEDELTIMGFQSIVNYCLRKSNSAAITSVLVSVFIAFPKSFGKSILPILRCKECYELDLERATREHTALSIYDERISYAQKERHESNNLPHRRKYNRGLRDFIFVYQLTIAELNIEILKIFDKFYETCGDNLLWEKAIIEMDSRKYKASKVGDNDHILQLEVEYSENVLSAVTTYTEERKYADCSLSFSENLRKVVEGSNTMKFDEWKAIYDHYTHDKNQNSMFDMPVSLAVIGLRDYSLEIDKSQKKWSWDVIANTLLEIVKQKLNHASFDRPPYNILEEETTIKAIHLLFYHSENENQLNDVKITIGYLFISDLGNHELNEYATYFRTKFYEAFPKFTLKLWSFLISYAKFHSENKSRYFKNSKDQKKHFEKKHKFISENILSDEVKYEDIDFEIYEAHYLGLAILLINSKTELEPQRKFILDFTKLILEDQKLEPEISYQRSKKSRKFNSQIIIRVQFHLNEILLYNDNSFTKDLLNIIISPYCSSDFQLEKNTADMYKFSQQILDTLITRFDDIVFLNDDIQIQEYGEKFWILWKELFNKIKLSGKNFFAKQLLLDSEWALRSDSWKGFIDQKKFYEEILLHFGRNNFLSVIKVFSSFGEKVFLPEKLSWVVKFISENPKNIQYLNSEPAKKMIQYLFNNHISTIKEDQNLVSDFMFILSTMVDIGLSEAYLIRECVIVYKRK